ncbi:MAG TPA: hypothetical protein VM598_12035 [Bdellovibrionota bacterium]|nr:hypothetical protein [Bdellovibrionota bacterium]
MADPKSQPNESTQDRMNPQRPVVPEARREQRTQSETERRRMKAAWFREKNRTRRMKR